MRSLRNLAILGSAVLFGLGTAGVADATGTGGGTGVTGTTVKTTLIGRGHGGAGTTAGITGPGTFLFAQPLDGSNYIIHTPIGGCTAPCGPFQDTVNGQEFSWQITGNQIIITAITNFIWGADPTDYGIKFDFAPNPHIASVKIDLSTNAPVHTSDILFSQNDVTFNFAPEDWAAGEKGVFDLGFNGKADVPEPAVWVMMLLGFGGVGGIIRRRNRALNPAL